ncbi:hypothetical protein QWZ13_19425 [Reinekea marina]|uniref:hypothetical protein n=1 Tax=Reinekea marina TaxID=1310421 RepID=UPI0025B55E41|nr:hypothetical protein [Reinekea marina]MDN3651087.1 hypothetical protein [Reinekea marina]
MRNNGKSNSNCSSARFDRQLFLGGQCNCRKDGSGNITGFYPFTVSLDYRFLILLPFGLPKLLAQKNWKANFWPLVGLSILSVTLYNTFQ